MADFEALTTASDPPPPLLTTARLPTIRDFILQFLTEGQVEQLMQQFNSSCQPNRQVMWTGMPSEEAQKWADQNDMQTLSTALGPFRKHSSAQRLNDGRKQSQVTYMRGASAVFAQYITTGKVVTLLCRPPPDRFNPTGVTNIQLVELPILTGIIGDHAVPRIEIVHPGGGDAEDIRYQFWPSDERDIRCKRFARDVEMTPWRQRARNDAVLKIENILRLLLSGSERKPIYQAILPQDTAASIVARPSAGATATKTKREKDKRTPTKTSKETTKKTPTKTTKETPTKTTMEKPTKKTKETPKKTSKETTKKALKEATKETTKETTETKTKKKTKKKTKGTPKSTTQETSKKNTKESNQRGHRRRPLKVDKMAQGRGRAAFLRDGSAHTEIAFPRVGYNEQPLTAMPLAGIKALGELVIASGLWFLFLSLKSAFLGCFFQRRNDD